MIILTSCEAAVCIDTLRNWVKVQNGSQADDAKQNRAFQSEIKAQKKQVADQ